MATLRETASFTHVTERIDSHAVLLSPSGREIVIATSEGRTIRFFDLATHLEVRGISGSSTTLYALDFSPDGTLLASAGSDVRRPTVDTGIRRRIFPTATETGTVAFSPDGTLLAFSTWERGVEIWAVAPQSEHDVAVSV